jgi:prepilin-type N-terminal cleavage/methylation domain-containing protein
VPLPGLRRGRRAGFTLTELLMALGIGTIIMFVTASVFSQAWGVFRQADAKMEALLGPRAALDIVEKDLAGAFLAPTYLGPQDPAFYCTTTDPTMTDPLVLSTTPVAPYGSPFDVPPDSSVHSGSRVYYFLQDDGARPGSALVRFDYPGDHGVPDDISSDWPSKVLLYGVTQFSVQFYDPYAELGLDSDGDSGWDDADGADSDSDGLVDEDPPDPWVDYWDSWQYSNSPHQYRRLPAAVRVRLTVIDREGFLGRPDQNPVRVQRIVEVGTRAPAQ